MRISREGPTVSLRGSPTVSPITVASWVGEPLPSPSTPPASTNFFALSQAPPLLAVNRASITADIVAPISRPPAKLGPNMKPLTRGTPTARNTGSFISRSAPAAEIVIQRL